MINVLISFIFYHLDSPLWNYKDMTWRTGDTLDTFTQNNGTIPSKGSIYYSNLPFEVRKQFPMYGTTDIGTDKNNTLFISRKMTSYMFHEAAQGMDRELTGWKYISSGMYLGPFYGEMDLYEKVFSKGVYYIDNRYSMFLLSDVVNRKQMLLLLLYITSNCSSSGYLKKAILSIKCLFMFHRKCRTKIQKHEFRFQTNRKPSYTNAK